LTHDYRFIVGIDLGTTNSAVSFVDLGALPEKIPAGGKQKLIRHFRVPQLTGLGEVNLLPVLPSFLYIPGEYDIAREAIALPWSPEPEHVVGALARDHGATVPARLVSSAKSWLCHGSVDRQAKILPWGSGSDIAKVSPVQATAAYLSHIRQAWNRGRGDDDESYLENQMVIITVPASFDEVARDLTFSAATMAGLKHVTLLEEPLAAFYAWLIRHEHHWRDLVQPGELILVCDVGGGTSDFTLIFLRETEGSPRFERIAVGDHLILGGDNIDLALARTVEQRFSGKTAAMGADRWKALCHQCRQAKETLLDGRAESVTITLMGKGGRLIAGTQSANLTRRDVESVLTEGFFPLVPPGTAKKQRDRKGITELGLPYEPEPAVTKHLCWFMEQHREEVARLLDGSSHAAPEHILFNGGSLKPTVIQERIRGSLRHWFAERNESRPRVLDNPYPDLAVALGAAYYGLVKTGLGVRVGSGSPRAYYLGVGTGDASQGGPEKAICLVERGLDEGSAIEVKDRDFTVITNQPVQFDVFSSSFRSGDRTGDLVAVDDTLTVMPPVQTVIEFGKKGQQSELPVHLEAAYTEMGTLSLWCTSRATEHRWKLQFQLRGTPAAGAEVTDAVVIEAGRMAKARDIIRTLFSGEGQREALASVVKDIAQSAGLKKERWPLTFLRSMADDLITLAPARHRVADLESRWMNLLGYCLRPGCGDAFDAHRMKQLWKWYHGGPVHDNNAQVRAEWWVMWRRLCAGLTPGQQRQFSQDLTSILMPKKGSPPKLPPQEMLEIWMLVANMEHLQSSDKIRWADRLLAEMNPKKAKPQLLWALSRLGARELLYGPINRVVPPGQAFAWCEALMGQTWRNPKPVGMALAQMARKTGDRARDLSNPQLQRIQDWLGQSPELAECLSLVTQVVPMASREESAIFGESLPAGLQIHET
jgi:molecular chaperone DnaK (HSP70)